MELLAEGDKPVEMLIEPIVRPAATAALAPASRPVHDSRTVEKKIPQPSSPEWLPPWEREQGSREVHDNNELESYDFQSQQANGGLPLDVQQQHNDDSNEDTRSSPRREPSPVPQQQQQQPTSPSHVRVFDPHKPGLTERSFDPSSCRVEGCARLPADFSKYCLAHSGVRKCATNGCTRIAGATGTMCVAHRRGRRCSYAGCTTAARGPTMLCVLHGGGKRCGQEGCSKSAQGATSHCKAHGGGECVTCTCQCLEGAPRYTDGLVAC